MHLGIITKGGWSNEGLQRLWQFFYHSVSIKAERRHMSYLGLNEPVQTNYSDEDEALLLKDEPMCICAY